MREASARVVIDLISDGEDDDAGAVADNTVADNIMHSADERGLDGETTADVADDGAEQSDSDDECDTPLAKRLALRCGPLSAATLRGLHGSAE